jgi:hypothetical protein
LVSQVLLIARTILDFSYYAQLQIHTNEFLNCLKNALSVFHANKNILLDLEVREHFNIPKLHQLSHYIQSILLFGTTNGFNTELPEQLHIDFAKEAYHASNKCNYEEQMAQWLQHQEPVFLCCSYLDWLLECSQLPTVTSCVDDEHRYESESDSDFEIEDSQTQPCSAVPANMAPMTWIEPCLVQGTLHTLTNPFSTLSLHMAQSCFSRHSNPSYKSTSHTTKSSLIHKTILMSFIKL